MGSNKPRIIVDGYAECVTCHKWFLYDEFPLMRSGKFNEYRLRSCQTCRTTQAYAAINADPERYITDKWRRTKQRAKQLEVEFTITNQEFIDQYEVQNGLCFYTDVPMIVRVGEGKHEHAASVDKVVPNTGYVSGNVVFCLNRINTIKHNVTLDEMRVWMPGWYERARRFLSEL